MLWGPILPPVLHLRLRLWWWRVRDQPDRMLRYFRR
jgi:hypothetical protein